MRTDFGFFHRLRVRYSEVDWRGSVYNAHYLTYMDVAIIEYFRQIGIDYKKLASEGKMALPLVKTTLEFKGFVMFDDKLEIGTRISQIGNTSYTVDFEIYKEGAEDLVLKAQTVYVNYNPSKHTAEKIPYFFRSLIEIYEQKRVP